MSMVRMQVRPGLFKRLVEANHATDMPLNLVQAEYNGARYTGAIYPAHRRVRGTAGEVAFQDGKTVFVRATYDITTGKLEVLGAEDLPDDKALAVLALARQILKGGR